MPAVYGGVMGSVRLLSPRGGLGYAQDAKEIFLDATDEKVSGPVSPRSLSDFGFLFLDKYNATDAIGVFRDCLEINGRYPPALLGLARARMFDEQPGSRDPTLGRPSR